MVLKILSNHCKLTIEREFMKNFIKLAACYAITMSLSACADNESDSATKAQPSKQVMNTVQIENNNQDQTINQWYTGTLKFYNLEGGFFGLTTEDGKQLLPLNLDNKYKKDGAIIKVFGHIDNNIMTIQMWGSPFKVISAEMISEGKPAASNQT